MPNTFFFTVYKRESCISRWSNCHDEYALSHTTLVMSITVLFWWIFQRVCTKCVIGGEGRRERLRVGGERDIQTAKRGINNYISRDSCLGEKQRWRAYTSLHARWKAPRQQSAHSRGPLSATLITLMAGNTNVLALSTIFHVSLGSFRVQTYCVNMPAVVMFCLPAIVFLSHVCLGDDEWEAVFIEIFALMIRREKWPLLTIKRPWIISYYLSFSLRTNKAFSGMERKDAVSQAQVEFLSSLYNSVNCRHITRKLTNCGAWLHTRLLFVPVITGVWELKDRFEWGHWLGRADPRKIMTSKNYLDFALFASFHTVFTSQMLQYYAVKGAYRRL